MSPISWLDQTCIIYPHIPEDNFISTWIKPIMWYNYGLVALGK